MTTPHLDQNAPLVPYRRERRIEVEPFLTAIGVIALVLLVGGWKPLADTAPADNAPSQLVSVKTAAATR